MAAQCTRYLFNQHNLIKTKGHKATGICSYLNDLDKLCSMQSQASTVEQIAEIDHLELALTIRTAYKFRSLAKALEAGKAKGQTLNNFNNDTHGIELYALA
jgi:hypothetical protein